MMHENKGNVVIHTFLFVITCFQPACSQRVNSFNSGKLNVISTVSDYKNSISKNSNKKLVLLKLFVNPLITDYKYATPYNFTHQVLYKSPQAYARLPVALALQKVQEDLTTKGLGLKFFDAYRPYSVTGKMWEIVPDERYAANPVKGSGHNRGVAVDVTLVEIASGKDLPMPSDFDDFSEKAHHGFTDLPENVLKNRALLKTTMERHGFKPLSTEWWHYSFADTTTNIEVLNLSFEQLKELENYK